MKLPIERKHLWLAVLVLLFAVGGYALSTSLAGREISVPEGTELHVRLSHSIATNRDSSGDSFHAVVTEPVMVDGVTAIPKGVPATGRIVSIRESGRISGVARMRLTLTSLVVNGKKYEIHTSNFGRQGRNHRKHNWAMIGGGAGGGALVGALAAG